MMDCARAIPVSVLTGFLGSGKTTLLSNLLRQPELSRAADLAQHRHERDGPALSPVHGKHPAGRQTWR